MNPYIQDILAQPQAMRDTLDALQRPSPELSDLAQKLKDRKFSRVILTGMGGSFAALYPMWLVLTRAGHAPHLVETSELIYDALPLIDTNTLLIVASQSGRSAEIVRLLDLTHGAPMLAITNTPDSPLAQAAAARLITHAGAEHTVSCKTYVTTLAALALCGAALADGDWQATLADLMNATFDVERFVNDVDSRAKATAALVKSNSLVLCGRGVSFAAAQCGGLIIKEAAKFHSEGMSGAAFRHGPMELATAGLTVFVYQGASNVEALNRKLVAEINQAGGHAYLIGASSEAELLRLPTVSPVALPIIEILPAQMLSVGLAWQNGREPGKFIVSGKVTLTE
jgi:glucosamine--fructose-6-phosphate aminotransferase (isomerizing)